MISSGDLRRRRPALLDGRVEARRDVTRRYRRPEQEALSRWTAQPAEHLRLLGALHTLGDATHAETVGQHDDARHDRLVLGISYHVAHERAVDLQLCRRQ